MGVAARKKNKRGLRFGANGTPSLIHSSTEPPRVRKPGRALKRRGVKSSRSATNDAATRLVEDIGHAPHETPRDLGGCPTLPAVGQRVRVLWDGMGMWYAGTVRGVKASTGEVLVVYDDGDEEWEALRAGSGTTWTFEGDAAEPADGRDGMLLTACMDRRAWTEMSIRVLRETGTWMSARGIIEAAVSQGWCVCNPDQVPQRLRSLLYDLAFRCDDPIFARQAKGIYGLAEWMLDGDCPAAAVEAGGPGGGGLAPGHNTHSIQPTDVLVPSHPRQCRDDIVGVDVVGGGVVGGDVVGGDVLEDYGDLPTWGPDNKAVRGPAPSLLRQFQGDVDGDDVVGGDVAGNVSEDYGGTTGAFAGDAAEPADGRDGMLLTACMDRRAWTEMSIRVLRETGTWMSARGIIEAAVSQGWCVCNPDQVASTGQRLRSLLYDLAFRCDDPIFARQAKGIYGLAEWMLDGDCPAAAVEAGGPGGGGLAPGHNTHSIQPTDVLVPSHPRQCRDDIVGVDVVGGGVVGGDVVGGVGLEDYGDLPTWGPDNKAVRGPAPSLLRQTPTAHEAIAGGYEYSEGEARSDDDDLFGDDRKWAIDLPDAQSLAPAGLAEEASTARMLDASAAAGHGLSCPLDLEVSPEEVADRISQVCEFVAACIDERRLPSISLRSGTASRPAFTMESNAAIVRFSRMMMALDIIHENLYGECTDGNSGITRITQRDLYYIARSRSSTIKAPQMMQTVQDVSLMLNVPRFAMGIDCRSKGMVYGPITLGGAVSCMRPRGSPISGSVPEIMDISSVNMEDVSAIVVVEKESVFQRLVREAPSHPVLSTCVIITGCGYPDVGTRAFLFRIVGQDRSIPVVGLVDWNASGAHILSQYVLLCLLTATNSPHSHVCTRVRTL